MTYMVITALTIFFVGWWASAVYIARKGRDDPQEIVVDEVAGQMLALAAAPRTLVGYAIAFALFRLFDIAKPFPANWCDRRLAGGLGVMADDMVAGVYSFIIMVLGLYIARTV
jgi:phosphatidylglycerophosphatase A